MINAEKYLKEGVDVEEFANKLCAFAENYELRSSIKHFLNKQTKPTLTEDERVILKNIDKRYKLICKDNAYNLFVKNGTYDIEKINPLNNLFQFIKSGEEYEIAELLKGE